VEVNPGTVDGEKFALLRQMGTNRLSIGVQSFCDRGLRLLGRVHSAAEAERAYARAREAGFANVSLDLIFSVPGLPEEDWRYSVERAVDLGPEHVSAYALTIEEGTPFARRQRQGRLSPLSEEEDLRQYEWAVERLSQAGYEQYEVSNFARPGYRSRHNWGYWTGAEYLGVGMSAHSFIDGVRFWNTRDLGGYLQAMEQGHSPRQAQEAIDQDTARRERWWLGLRTDQGIVLSVEERACLAGESRFADLRKAGYVRLEGDRLRLTRPGLALADGLGVELTTILERSPKPQRKPAAA
jgi:oxygen-independent coproporphyrinogen-3 oxidase